MKSLRIIRPANLLMVLLTMVFVRYFLIAPVFKAVDFQLIQSNVQFALLVLSTLLISAAGYIINDYFDTRIDQVNRPSSMVIGRKMERRVAILWHWGLSISGLLIALYLAWKSGVVELIMVQIMAVFVLYKYSEIFKRKFLTGNILVSFLTALVVLLPAIYEVVALGTLNFYFPEKSKWLLLTILAYSVFAFISNLIRELIKDMEDIEGDLDSGCRTVPIVMGVKNAKRYSYVLISVALILCVWFQIFKNRQEESYAIFYVILFIQVPFLLIIRQLGRSTEKAHFTRASKLLKLVIFLGIISIPILRIIKGM